MHGRSSAAHRPARVPLPDMDAMAAGLWAIYHADPDNDDARNGLLMIYKPLADRGAAGERRRGGDFYDRGSELDFADLRQIAFLALLDLIGSYDPAINSSFTKYASPLIRRRIMDGLRSQSWISRNGRRQGYRDNRISGDARISANGGDEGKAVFDLVECQEEGPTMPAERQDFIELMMNRMPEARTRRIFSLKFLDRVTDEQVAKYLGVSAARVSQIMHRSILPVIADAFPDAPGGFDGVHKRVCGLLSSNSGRSRQADKPQCSMD